MGPVVKGLVFLAVLLGGSLALAVVLEGKSVVMKAPDGSREKYKDGAKELQSDRTMDIILEIPVKLSRKKFRCDSAKETPWRLQRKIESKLELQGIIDSLNKSEIPRSLTDAQVKMLERVPPCEPFLLQLKVISRLLRGYDIERVTDE